MSGLAGSGSSASNGLSSSSYCRRLGSASNNSNSSRRSATFQLWSPRLRLRDERKRVLKLSLAKLRRIDDTESCLRRSVLLNNTLRRLQREARDEKTGQNDHGGAAIDSLQCSRLQQHPAVRLVVDSSTTTESKSMVLSCDELPVEMTEATPRAGIKRRRSADVCEESTTTSSPMDCGGLNFGDLYLPPTPRMISSLEDEEEAEAWQCVKRPKIGPTTGNDVSGRNRPALRPCNSLPSSTTTSSTTTSTMTSSSNTSSLSAANQNSSPILSGYTSCLTSGLSLVNSNSSAAATAQQSSVYSCGQSSLFGELQSVVFHSLITSLES